MWHVCKPFLDAENRLVSLTKGLSQHLNRKHVSFLFKCASTSHPPSHPSFLICFLLQTPPFVMQIWRLNDGKNTHSENFPDSIISTYSSGKKKWAPKQKRERVSRAEILKGAMQRGLLCIKCPYTCVYLGSDVFFGVCAQELMNDSEHFMLSLWELRLNTYMNKHYNYFKTHTAHVSNLLVVLLRFQMLDDSSVSYSLVYLHVERRKRHMKNIYFHQTKLTSPRRWNILIDGPISPCESVCWQEMKLEPKPGEYK